MKLIQQLKDAGQDHEFYPTTKEIIACLLADMQEHHSSGSLLDIGAGNGKVLKALSEPKDMHLGPLYAIEKSTLLQQQMDAGILVIGTEFAEQSLFSKPVDVVFCNPPYSQFEQWMIKIIREAAAKCLYLVVPRRWQDNPRITDAIKYRGVLMPGVIDPEAPPPEPVHLDTDHPDYKEWLDKWKYSYRYYEGPNQVKILGEFDFEDAEDRKARAKVHLLRIDLERDHRRGGDGDDAFARFFKEQFADLIGKFGPEERKREIDEITKPATPDRFPLTIGGDYIETLVGLYLAEMGNIERNYRLVAELDVDLLREFEIYPSKIMACLKQRLSGLKNDYWQELFGKMSKLTDRLTRKSRESLLKTLQAHVQVDFTVGNIHAVVLWALKNVNRYLNSQLIAVYELMVDKCNVQNYTSNQRTWQQEDWRYNNRREDLRKNSHYALDYRIVMQSVGGLSTYEYDWDKRTNNQLKGECFDFLQDLLTIANNLGFMTTTQPIQLCRGAYEWQSNSKEEFFFTNVKSHKRELLFDARAFKNGNLHLRLNQRFILALNVEHGRLKGWIRSGEEAAAELGDLQAAQHFNTHLQLPMSKPTHLLLAA